MPIGTDSEAWEDAETPESVTAATLRFLSEHPDTAFSIYEISDFVMGTEFDKMYENSQIREQHRNGEIPVGELGERTHDIPEDRYMDSRLYLKVQLQELVEEGLIESRSVDPDETAVPTDRTVSHYTYALEDGDSE